MYHISRFGRNYFTSKNFSGMQKKHLLLLVLALVLVSGASAYYLTYYLPVQKSVVEVPGLEIGDNSSAVQAKTVNLRREFNLPEDPKPLPDYLARSIDWLVASQAADGGWGAGLHTRQDVTDPHAVKTDPATTAVAGMALIRVGNTLDAGPQHLNLRKALVYLLKAVENTPEKAINITTQHGTQPQTKLGENIDVALTSQFFSRVLPLAANRVETEKQIQEALAKCVMIIENGQQKDGSWSVSGWAPVLNSAMACNALELADLNGMQVDSNIIKRAQAYQRGNVSASGSARTDKSAGIALYSLSSSQRNNVQLSKKAEKVLGAPMASQKSKSVAELKKDLADKGVAADEAQALSEAVVTYNAVSDQMDRDDVLSGFGNNGGEEFLSYMMTSESYVHAGDDKWEKWYAKMSGLFAQTQNKNGSWSGHHCITSPVFCTAVVIMTLTPDRDPLLLASKD